MPPRIELIELPVGYNIKTQESRQDRFLIDQIVCVWKLCTFFCSLGGLFFSRLLAASVSSYFSCPTDLYSIWTALTAYTIHQKLCQNNSAVYFNNILKIIADFAQKLIVLYFHYAS